jgi:hypothetical protein
VTTLDGDGGTSPSAPEALPAVPEALPAVPGPLPEPTGGPTSVDGARRDRRLAVASLWAFPLIVLVVMGVLTGLGLNGSSVARVSHAWSRDPNVVAGTPRAVRSDEFTISTPVQVGNERKGYPAHAWIGLTDVQYSVTSMGVPTRTWLAVFEPSTWPRLLPGGARGYDAAWWILGFGGMLGLYAFFVSLRRAPLAAAVAAVTVGLSPLAAWWLASGPTWIAGLVAGSGAAFLAAVRTRSRWRAVGLGTLAGYLLVAAFLVLYPPWFVSVTLVVGAAVIGACVADRVPWRRFMLVAAVTVVVLVGVLGAWAWQSADALTAVKDTIYPGGRISVAGQGNAAILSAAPLNPVLAQQFPPIVPGRVTSNQSELSAPWFPLPMLAALLVLLAVRLRHRPATATTQDGASSPARWDLRPHAVELAVSVVLLLLLAWMLLPLPSWFGTLTQLSRVPGDRATLALGVGAGVLLVALSGRLRIRRPRWEVPVLLVGVAGTAYLTVRAAQRLLLPGASGIALSVALSALVAAGFALMTTTARYRVAGALLVLAVVANWAVVNPLYRGLGPLTHGPLASYLAATAAAEGPTRWVALAGATEAEQVIMASRDELLSGMTYYPTRSVWERLAPTQATIWNNYSKYRWVYDPSADPAVLEPVHGTNRDLRIDLCSPQVAFLDISYVVSTGPPPPCFTRVTTIRDLGRSFVISRRS